MAGSKYLRLFNAASGALWGLVLVRLLVVLPLVGFDYVAENLAPMVSWVQSLAILEVVHAVLGLVRSSPLTVAAQVASRLILIWGVVRLFPSAAVTPAFSSMVLAWSITEVIRYPYYWCQLRGSVPYWLEWARYNFFLVLYPLGAGSELWQALRAQPLASFYHPYYGLFLKVYVVIIPPALYYLFTHMLKQRSKALYGSRSSKARVGEKVKAN